MAVDGPAAGGSALGEAVRRGRIGGYDEVRGSGRKDVGADRR